jgi:Activator of Hsp90 ATPase homolog 1-like protein
VEHRLTYTEITPLNRLVYTHMADFIPAVEPYEVGTMVEFHSTAQGVRLVLTSDAMHDEHWTKMAVMGWESELTKLAKVLKRNE